MSTHVSPRRSSSVKPSPKAGDVVAGAGSGGVLVYIAQHLIKNPEISQIAVYLCPALSIFFISIYQKISAYLTNSTGFYLAEAERRRLKKQSDKDVADLRRKVTEIEADPRATEKHKIELREELEAAEKAHIKLMTRGSIKAEAAA